MDRKGVREKVGMFLLAIMFLSCLVGISSQAAYRRTEKPYMESD